MLTITFTNYLEPLFLGDRLYWCPPGVADYAPRKLIKMVSFTLNPRTEDAEFRYVSQMGPGVMNNTEIFKVYQ